MGNFGMLMFWCFFLLFVWVPFLISQMDPIRIMMIICVCSAIFCDCVVMFGPEVWCVFGYAYVYVYMHLCMYVCMHACMYVCMCVCMYSCVYVCMHVCMYACMYACMHVCTHACMHVRSGSLACFSLWFGPEVAILKIRSGSRTKNDACLWG